MWKDILLVWVWICICSCWCGGVSCSVRQVGGMGQVVKLIALVFIISCMRFFISRHRMNRSLGVWQDCFVGRVAEKEYHCNKHNIKSKDKQKRELTGAKHTICIILNFWTHSLENWSNSYYLSGICLGLWNLVPTRYLSVCRQKCHCFSSSRQQNGHFRPPYLACLIMFTKVISQHVMWSGWSFQILFNLLSLSLIMKRWFTHFEDFIFKRFCIFWSNFSALFLCLSSSSIEGPNPDVC